MAAHDAVVDPEINAFRRRLDEWLRNHPFMRFPREDALWYLVSQVEVQPILNVAMGATGPYYGELSKHLKLCQSFECAVVAILSSENGCSPGGSAPKAFDYAASKWAKDFIQYSVDYSSLVDVFGAVDRREMVARMVGPDIVLEELDPAALSYNAYAILVRSQPSVTYGDISPRLVKAIKGDFTLKDGLVHTKLSGRIMAQCVELGNAVRRQYERLPREWQFARYSLAQFGSVVSVIWAIALYYYYCRTALIEDDQLLTVKRLMENSVQVWDRSKLIEFLARWANVDEFVAGEVVDDLTLGHRGVEWPDPSLQPLLPFSGDRIGLAASFTLNLDFERNLSVLFQKFSEERRRWGDLSNEKEAAMIVGIRSEIGDRFRCESGRMPKPLPDVDLLIIDDTNKVALLCELKWWIAPAEPHEERNRSELLKKGIEQLRTLMTALTGSSADELRGRFGLDSSYTISPVLVSTNWIGRAIDQDESIPVITTDHLVAKLVRSRSLSGVVPWLTERRYLPQPGLDYQTSETVARVVNQKVRRTSIRITETKDFIAASLDR